MANGKARLGDFIKDATISFADSEPRHTVTSRNLQQHERDLVLKGTTRRTDASSEPPETPPPREDRASVSPLFCSHRVFLVFHFLGFVCRSMPMLEKLSMPLAVRLAGITNCHVFVHALRTIK